MANPFASPDPPPEPKISPPPPMPDPSSPDVLAAKRRTTEAIMGRAGRQSTILSNAMSRGESAYSATKLGTGV